MKLIIDTNVWISFLIGKRLSSLVEIFKREDIVIYVSDQLLGEITEVAHRRKFKGIIKPDSLFLLFELLQHRCVFISVQEDYNVPLRDAKDIFLLSMSHEVNADYLITGDQDLLVLKSFEGTRILTFAEFTKLLNSCTDS